MNTISSLFIRWKLYNCISYSRSLTPSVLVHRFQSYLWAHPDMGTASQSPTQNRSSQFYKSRNHKMSFHHNDKCFYAIWHKGKKWDVTFNVTTWSYRGQYFPFIYQPVGLPQSIEVRKAPTVQEVTSNGLCQMEDGKSQVSKWEWLKFFLQQAEEVQAPGLQPNQHISTTWRHGDISLISNGAIP